MAEHENKDRNQPTEQELFGRGAGLNPKDVFAGDEEFFKTFSQSPTGPEKPTPQQQPTPAPEDYDFAQNYPQPQSARLKRFTAVQLVLLMAILAIASMVGYAWLSADSPRPSQAHQPGRPADTPAATEPNQPLARQSLELAAVEETVDPLEEFADQPLGLELAQQLYARGQYDQAAAVYDRLAKALPGDEQQLMRDFLNFQKALCLHKSGSQDEAVELYRQVLTSSSPVLKALVNYHLAIIELDRSRFRNARRRAYNALALIDSADPRRQIFNELREQCDFIAAESLSRYVLALRDDDNAIPARLWTTPNKMLSFLTDADEATIRAMLDAGIDDFRASLLSPRIRPLAQGSRQRYAAVATQEPIGQLLARIASHADMDVVWDSTIDQLVHKRPVNILTTEATAAQLARTAAGAAGLIAWIDPEQEDKINIYDPENYNQLNEHLQTITKTAANLWQGWLLRYPESQKLAKVHFATALLDYHDKNFVKAAAECRLIANRFHRHSVAPYALLLSSRVKTHLKDYAGAQRDLTSLVQIYHAEPVAEQAYLELAQATERAGLNRQAAEVYERVYNMGLDRATQQTAALSAARCHLRSDQLQNAQTWIKRYLNSASKDSENYHQAYLLLGKANLRLDRVEQAASAFRYALTGSLDKDQYLPHVPEFIEALTIRGKFLEAIEIIEDARSANLTSHEDTELLILESSIYRAMKLPNRLLKPLREKTDFITETRLRNRLLYEIALCQLQVGQTRTAHNNLTDLMARESSQQMAQQIGTTLAKASLELGRYDQAIQLAQRLLEQQPSRQLRQKLADIKTTAHLRLNDYDQAARTLIGAVGTETDAEGT